MGDGDLKPLLIAIDGPVAVGKSSVGSLLARKLSYIFFDTGTMYRAFTWKTLKTGTFPEDENKLCHLANTTKFDFVSPQEGHVSILIDEEDVSSKLLCPMIEEQVSIISKIAGVRRIMVSEQRRLAQRGRVIMAGRDIGTVVLPWAELKIFLVASAEKRASRRYKELLEKGREIDYDTTLAELKRRDEIDINRTISPLKPAADAIIINTEDLSLEQVVDKIYALTLEFSG
jgi:cytidylate kinase